MVDRTSQIGSAGFVLLGGSGSSGTTLLAACLDGLHDIRTSPETWLFHQRELYTNPASLPRLLREGGEEISRPIDRLLVPLVPGGCFAQRERFGITAVDDAASGGLSTFVAYVKQAMVDKWGGPSSFLWIDQTPKNAYAAREYLQADKDARFVHMLRDGRDVVCSLIRRWQREAPGHPMRSYVLGAAMNWAWDVTQARRARSMPGYLEVRYEDFVRDPVLHCNRVLQHLGRPPVSGAVFAANRQRERAAHMDWGAKPTWGATPDQAIRTDNIGRWKQVLAPETLAALRGLRFRVPGEGEVTFGGVLDSCGHR